MRALESPRQHSDLATNVADARVRVSGKFFRIGQDKWYARGFCYGPFSPNRDGDFLPEPLRCAADLAHMKRLGATCLRTYFPPPTWLLETALENGLRVLVDVPWEKHRCFFEDWSSHQEARAAVRDAARVIGGHAAVFAISVANEIPNDIVRFYGQRRVQHFLDELLDIVHQQVPNCLTTYTNFPTTEFLQPSQQDFCCFNVYLHDPEALGKYLDRLQHVAGTMPLVIAEYGIDSLRQGEHAQAVGLVDYSRTALGHGAAGSMVFSYTDDWFTGGHQIEEWAFGVTRKDRSEKKSARSLEWQWNGQHERHGKELPKVSVIVCSYNGAATLEECLHSLMRLDYPDYEVILVDDGSEDNTPEIASQFPQVNYIRQSNEGLSAARNVGLQAADGEIVAYTDSDCIVDEDWLSYLVHGFQSQQVDAIGGPNLTPASDNWTAKCVAVSPGNPSHVMFDDQFAEHIPGCNMAFRRKALLAIGGFDPQFRQAGDDVDVCWRLLSAGCRIGYAAAAMVWHHRRCTVTAYYSQQKGYGRAEAILAFKHPQRFLATGRLRFDGVIYGDGVAGLPLLPARVYHGRFGSALFQTIYQSRDFRFHARATSLEWHGVSALCLLLSPMIPQLALVSVAMWATTLGSVAVTVREAAVPKEAPRWSRWLVFWLHLTQPLVRGLHRNGYSLRNKRLPQDSQATPLNPSIRRLGSAECELHWETTSGQGREMLLDALVDEARKSGWPGDFYGGWVPWDIELMADLWHHVTVRTATEELGGPNRFTRARWATASTRVTRAAVAGVGVWCTLAVTTNTAWAMIIGVGCSALLLFQLVRSRNRCLRAVGQLIGQAADASGLTRRRREATATGTLEKSPHIESDTKNTEYVVARSEPRVGPKASKV